MTASSATLPTISIIVPFHNVERYIAACVEGLLGQSYPKDRFEIVLVDNCSTDKSAEIASRFDGVSVLHQPIAGSYAARNMGIRNTRSDIVATIDPDCTPNPDWLSQISQTMSANGCSIVLGHTHHGNGSR